MIIDQPRASQREGLRALWKEAFGDGDAFLDTFARTAFSAERCRCVTIGTETVAALYWFDCSCRDRRVAYLYAIATAKAYRGRGLCRALMEDTHAHLRSLGYAAAILVPSSEELFGFYEKLGYRTCSSIGEICVHAAEASPGNPLSLRAVDAEEYAAKRRTLLPSGGVVQEEENLSFLQSMAELYVGDGLTLAARVEGETLVGVELLGDPSHAPAILHAFGCSVGRFRVPKAPSAPKDERAFAMFYPLDEPTLAPPTYFGLAFD